ncbi:MAG: DUF1788 domain-containing protein [Lachnospiraceae bacterium]|nr:DUF1788 domain-containing protein [Lachnospiraceae bacterium]
MSKIKTTKERMQKLRQMIESKTINKLDGLGGEINFWIFDYDPEEEYYIRENIKDFINDKYDVQVYNIYKIIIEILEEKGYLKKVIEYEKKKGTDKANDAIRDALEISSNNDKIIKYIREHQEEDKTVILTGIGDVYGVVRPHTILNNLQSVVERNPLIMFYPGVYTGQEIKLFGKANEIVNNNEGLESNNYYRAFRFE